MLGDRQLGSLFIWCFFVEKGGLKVFFFFFLGGCVLLKTRRKRSRGHIEPPFFFEEKRKKTFCFFWGREDRQGEANTQCFVFGGGE